MKNSFIKLYRQIIHWEWYKTTNTKVLFLHCLLRANWEAGEWRGISYDAGEFITSIASLAEETGLSVQEVRTALAHLKATHELTQRVTYDATNGKTAKCSVITVNNWGEYQGSTRRTTRKSTRKSTTVKEKKERGDAESLPDGLAPAPEEDDEEWVEPSLAKAQFKEEMGDEGTI